MKKIILLAAISIFYFADLKAQNDSTDDDWVTGTYTSTTNRVGIGTTNPQFDLQIRGTGIQTFEVQSDDNQVTWALDNTGSNGKTIRYRTNGATVGGIQMPGGTSELRFQTGGTTDRMVIDATGRVGIGTMTPQSELAVNGKITCKEVEVTLTGFPDYVFTADYKLMSLSEVEAFINKNGHLPNMPSEREVIDNGIGLGELNVILVEKVEELTLHTIEQEKKIKELTEMLKKLLEEAK